MSRKERKQTGKTKGCTLFLHSSLTLTKKHIPLIAASVLFALATVFEYRRQGVSLVSCVGCFAMAAALFFAVSLLLCRTASNNAINRTSSAFGVPKRVWLVFFLIIFCFYLFNWLTHYPMAATRDSTDPINMGLGNIPLAAWHPLIWVLIVIFFVKVGLAVGDVNTGLAILTFIQFVIAAGILSYAGAWLRGRGAPKTIAFLVALAFALDPVIAQYSIYVSKDGIFAFAALLYFLMLFDIVETNGECLKRNGFLVRFAIVSLFVGMLRLNALYVTLAMLVILLIAYRKQAWKRISALFAVPLFLMLLTGPGYDALGIEKSPFSESASVPLTQVGYVIAHGGDLDDESAEILNRILPLDEWEAVYDPRCTNSVKFHDDFDQQYFEDHKIDFLKAWFTIGTKNAAAYLDAWLLLTEGYWNIDSTDWIAPAGKQYPFGEHYDTEPGIDGLVASHGLLSDATGIESLDRNVGSDVAVLKDSRLIYPLYNNAIAFWFIILLVVASIAMGRGWRFAIPYLMPLLIVATVLIASPIWCEFRYVFALHVCMPIALVAFFRNTGKHKEIGIAGHERT